MNRLALGLAVGAGYVLGRSRKARVALVVGGLVAGKRMNLSPKAVGELVSRQLRENPQFKEIGDQLRQDLSGIGKAASGALVERRLDSLADRLHGRTARVRDRLAGTTPEVPGARRGADEDPDAYDEPGDDEDGPEARDERGTAEDTEAADREATEGTDETGRRGKAPARKKQTGKSAPVKKTPARRATAKKASAGTAAAKKATAAGKPAARKASGTRRGAEGARGRRTKGSGDQ
ncbi:DNA primase [Streptomyces sp. DH24]|uniref:DNA primase n=1 Tax=Streptomyces sp. DH24 TaxID=3040123 RepID=UPI002442761C|nr:DNA primase [Streptomyces sp. DH24]MDG9717764.1 DNA primase [Streptomyces sp. DH24]